MTRRERLEAKLEKRQEWAQKATFRAAARFEGVRKIADAIPFGQPILVGHHSERHARADQARIHNGMRKACELSNLAAHHQGAAAGIERMLRTSTFSDDPDAIEQLEAKIAKGEAAVAKMKAANQVIRRYKKGGPEAQVAALTELGFPEKVAQELIKPDYAGRIGFASYALTNENANIRRMKKRIEEIKVRQARTAAAEAAPGGAIIKRTPVSNGTEVWCTVTFAEKPEREILEALRAAGFRWGGGSWSGLGSKLPAELATL